LQRILILFTYAKLEYVNVRAYPPKHRIRTLRILEPCIYLFTLDVIIGTINVFTVSQISSVYNVRTKSITMVGRHM